MQFWKGFVIQGSKQEAMKVLCSTTCTINNESTVNQRALAHVSHVLNSEVSAGDSQSINGDLDQAWHRP